VPTSAFKELEFSCLPEAARTAVFHSSGTTGQRPSRHFHCAESLAVYEEALLAWFGVNFFGEQEFQISNCRAERAQCGPTGQSATDDWRLVILTPPPSQAPHSSLVYMFETIRRACGAPPSAFVGGIAADNSWTLGFDAIAEALAVGASTSHLSEQGAGEGRCPIILLGTAFSFVHLLDHLEAQGLSFQLPPGSRVMETGGYKGRSRALPKQELHALLTQRLGIPPTRIICEYGMSELSSQAYDPPRVSSRVTRHASRSFHFPPWVRVQLVSPETGLPVREGETGLIQVFDLANVYSVMAIQTEDLGVRRGEGFELIGRAALAEPRGCSLMASRI
jgi:hypothetical protein